MRWSDVPEGRFVTNEKGTLLAVRWSASSSSCGFRWDPVRGSWQDARIPERTEMRTAGSLTNVPGEIGVWHDTDIVGKLRRVGLAIEACGAERCGSVAVRWPSEEERVAEKEEEVVETIPETGTKHNKGKVRLGLLPSEALVAIGEVLTKGAIKYNDHNWRLGLPWSEVYDACQRHLTEWNSGQDKDPEWGLSHLAHAGCCIMFLLAYEITKTGTDDRWKGA